MNIPFIDKITYYIKNQYHLYNTSYYPYKKVITDDWLNDRNNKNDSHIMNCIITGYEIEEVNFPRKKKVTLYFAGDRIFNTILYVESHQEINDTVQKMTLNSKQYSKKIKNKFNDFLNHLYYVKYDGTIIDVTKIINNCIQYENNIITFSDISYLHHEIPLDIRSIKIVYTKSMKKIEKEIDFARLKNEDIDILNNISKIN